jgi:hypothetical protein
MPVWGRLTRKVNQVLDVAVGTQRCGWHVTVSEALLNCAVWNYSYTTVRYANLRLHARLEQSITYLHSGGTVAVNHTYELKQNSKLIYNQILQKQLNQ